MQTRCRQVGRGAVAAAVTDSTADRSLAIARAMAAHPIAVDPAGTELVVVAEPELNPDPR